MSTINFQTLLDQQVGRVPSASWPATPSIVNLVFEIIESRLIRSEGKAPDKTAAQKRIAVNSLRFQGAAWATAGGSMLATLSGVFKIFRNFRGFKYI
jgi:hypothetical protein